MNLFLNILPLLKGIIDLFTKGDIDFDDLLIGCLTKSNKRPQIYPFSKGVYKINYIFYSSMFRI